MADETIESMIVQIRADISGLKEGLQGATDATKNGAKSMSDGLKDLGKTMAGVFSIVAIANFVKASLKEFAEFEHAMTKLGKVVSGTGEDWQKLKGGVAQFADELERTTKFQDNEVVDALSRVQFKVKDLATAMGITRMATKLATLSGEDLATTSNTLALAYEGNSRGLMSLAKSLGVVGVKATDAKYLFEQLEKQTSAVSGDAEDLTTSFMHFGKLFKNIMQEVGEALAPATRWFLTLSREWIPEAWRTIKGLGVSWVGIFLDLVTWINYVKGVWSGFFDFLKMAVKHPIDALEQWSLKAQQLSREREAELRANAQTSQVEFDKIYIQDTKKYKEASDKKIAIQAGNNKKRIEDEKKMMELLAQRAKQQAEELKALLEITSKEIAKFYTGTIQHITETVLVSIMTQKDAYKELGKSIVKSLIGALVKIAEQYAEFYAGKAIADLLTENYVGAGEDALAAGKWAAVAGAISAAGSGWAGLAEGGVVTGPTRALIGEGGEPEMVVPLSKAGDMGFGGNTINGGITISLPNVRNASDFTSSDGKRSVARAMSDMLDSVQRRKGLSLSSGVA